MVEHFDVEGHLAASLDRVGLGGGQCLAQGQVILRIVEAEVEGAIRVGIDIAVVHRLAVVQQRDRQGLHIGFAEHLDAIVVLVVVVVRIDAADGRL